MTNAVPIQSQNHLSVANTLRLLLRRAEQGELDGFIYLASSREGADKIGLCGRYAEDLDLAVSSAAAGFNTLLGHKVCVEQDSLPRRIRKSPSAHACSVVACSMRK